MSRPWYRWQNGDLILRIWAQPRAKCDEIVGMYGDFLKIRITAAPTDGNANDNITNVLAGVLHVAPTRVRLLSGASNRGKTFCISGPLPSDACQLLAGEDAGGTQ